MTHAHAIGWRTARVTLAVLCWLLSVDTSAQTLAAPPESVLFAVEITVGPNWDGTKPAHEQAYFREHSRNLKRLRDSGALVMGARYADKGLVLIAASDDVKVRDMLEEDASIRAGIFRYQVHPFVVFYGGTLNARPATARP